MKTENIYTLILLGLILTNVYVIYSLQQTKNEIAPLMTQAQQLVTDGESVVAQIKAIV